MVNAWKETSLPTLLSNYELTDIYNADEFGPFYKCVINKSYQFKSEKCSGGKLSKIRTTGMAAANAVGDKIPMFSLENPKNHVASRTSSFYLADIEIKKRAGWMGPCLKSGCEN